MSAAADAIEMAPEAEPTGTRHLYEIARDYRQLKEMPPEVIGDTLEGLEHELVSKVESIAKVRQELLRDVEAVKAEVERLNRRREIIENRDRALRAYLAHHLDEAGRATVETPLFRVTITPPRRRVEIEQDAKIPDEYVTMETREKPDKAALLAALEAGEIIEGVRIAYGEPGVRTS